MTLEALDRAAGYATCQMLGAGGAALVGSAVWTAGSGPAALIPLSLGALSYMAQDAFCGPIDLGDVPEPISDQIDGCGQISEGGYGQFQIKMPGGTWSDQTDKWQYTQAVRIVPDEPFQTSTDGTWAVNCGVYTATDGTTDTVGGFATESDAAVVKFRIVPSNGSTCAEYGGGDIPAIPPIPDVTYVDEQTNCTFNMQFDGFFAETPSSVPGTVWTITEAAGLKATSAVVGGCAVNNIRIYKPSNGGPNIPIDPPGGGGGGGGGQGPGGGNDPELPPDWFKPLLDVLLGAAGIQLANLINELFGYREEANWTLNYPCEVDEEGNPLVKTYTTEGWGFDREMYTRTNLLAEMINDQFNGKTPICGNEKPEPEGDFRTISFRSETTSPYGKSCLRKRFRYRSQSGIGLGELIDYWKDFTVESGPYRVRHTGANWGNLEVWAATEDEGKRVIRHAGGEAGIDPDQVGRWSTRRSDSARLGVPASMKVDTTGGYYWITARDGSNNRPEIGLLPNQ